MAQSYEEDQDVGINIKYTPEKTAQIQLFQNIFGIVSSKKCGSILAPIWGLKIYYKKFVFVSM